MNAFNVHTANLVSNDLSVRKSLPFRIGRFKQNYFKNVRVFLWDKTWGEDITDKLTLT